MGPMRSHSAPLPCTRLVGAWKCAGETGAAPALHCTYSQRLQRLVVRVTRRRLLISIISLRIQSHVICDNNTQQSAARSIRRVPDLSVQRQRLRTAAVLSSLRTADNRLTALRHCSERVHRDFSTSPLGGLTPPTFFCTPPTNLSW